MPLNSLLDILKKQFKLFFFFPVLLLIATLISGALFFKLQNKKEEENLYVETLKLPLTNSLLSFEVQESNFLLGAIAKHLKWSKAYLVNNDKKVIAEFGLGKDHLTSVGKTENIKCANHISLMYEKIHLGGICYERSFWSLLDISTMLILAALLGIIFFMWFLHFKLMAKLNYFFKKLGDAVEALEDNKITKAEAEFKEEQMILSAVNDKIALLEKIKQREIKDREQFAKFEVAIQVAHDIRAPLSALKVIEEQGIEGIQSSKELKEIFNFSIQRITDIADDLLKTNRNQESLEKINLKKQVEKIIFEKNLILKNKKEPLIELFIDSPDCIFVSVFCNDFSRAISNLLNNAIEAIPEIDGKICVSISLDCENVVVTIIDNGRGIPEKHLNEIGKKGVSFGKDKNDESGSGIGLYYAIKTIEDSSGKLLIESKENVGTKIRIFLPYELIGNKILLEGRVIVLFEDDELVKATWELKAKKLGIEIFTFSNWDDFILEHKKKQFSFSTHIFSDINLKNNISGIDIVTKLNTMGFENLHLCTGYEKNSVEVPSFIKTFSGKSFPENLFNLGLEIS